MDLETNKALVKRFSEAANAADWGALEDLLTQNFRRHCQATPDVEVNSRQEFIELQKGFLVSFPDQRVTLEMIIAEGDHVATYGAYTATHTGPMGTYRPPGKRWT